MTRIELAAAIGAAMLLAAALGWLLHALWARLAHRPQAVDARAADLARRLADAEESRDRLAAEAAAAHAALMDSSREAEVKLRRDLTERTAELSAAMDTIGALRREIDVLRGAA